MSVHGWEAIYLHCEFRRGMAVNDVSGSLGYHGLAGVVTAVVTIDPGAWRAPAGCRLLRAAGSLMQVSAYLGHVGAFHLLQLPDGGLVVAQT